MQDIHVSQVFVNSVPYESYCVNLTFNCDTPLPPCINPAGLVFEEIWGITTAYYDICPKGPWLVGPPTSIADAALTRAAARAILGDGRTLYPKADVVQRLSTWKIPLTNLMVASPRPPLGVLVNLLAFCHLAADPMGTMEDLLYKLETCQKRGIFWQEQIRLRDVAMNISPSEEEMDERERLGKALTLITESYNDLCDSSDNRGNLETLAEDVVSVLKPLVNAISAFEQQKRASFVKECIITAHALAADRATTFSYVIVSELLFIAVFFLDMGRLESNEKSWTSGTSYVNIELHCIGFSALFFWLIPTVMTAAIIGTSQKANAIPRILMRFRRDLHNQELQLRLPLLDETTNCRLEERWWYGLYSWQSKVTLEERFSTIWSSSRIELRYLRENSGWRHFPKKLLLWLWPFIYSLLPLAISWCAIATGVLISYYVEPGGWKCRTHGEIYFGYGWTGSYVLTKAITWFSPKRAPQGAPRKRKWLPRGWNFYVMLLKDLCVTCGIVTWIILTQIGWYNKPECYEGPGTGLLLPLQNHMYQMLEAGIHWGGSFLSILVVGVVVQLILFPALIFARYSVAIHTFLHNDTKASELSNLHSYLDPVQQVLPTKTAGPPARPTHITVSRVSTNPPRLHVDLGTP